MERRIFTLGQPGREESQVNENGKSSQDTLVILAVFLALALAALIIVTVLYCVMKYGKRMTIARHLTSDQAEDAMKYGEGLVSGSTADDLAQKQEIPYKIVLSMTTSPKRMKHLHNQLQIIHPAMVDSIEINVPKVYKPTGETYEISQTLKTMPKVKIFQYDHDLGPIMKIVPTLERYKDDKVIVLSIDDDAVYSTKRLGQTLKKMHEYKYRAVICNNYFSNLLNRYHFPKRPDIQLAEGDKSVDIVEGFSMVAYPSWLTNWRQMKEFSQVSKPCFQSDDLTISYSLALHNVPRIRIKQPDILPINFALTMGFQGDALHKRQWHKKAYQICANTLRDLVKQ